MADSKKSTSRILRISQNQLKRQREWVYLAHFLAMLHLHPSKTISGSDDGQEPDFTCVFQSGQQDYVVGIELTTLPRLRDRLGNENLMLKRWYWQSLLQVSTKFTPTKMNQQGEILGSKGEWQTIDASRILNLSSDQPQQSVDSYRPSIGIKVQNQLARTMRWLPSAFFTDMANEDEALPIDSFIIQDDIDAVMNKKSHKVPAYHKKRKLDEVWLLIHTNEQQENGLLKFDSTKILHHHSDFNRVFVTLYPATRLLQIAR